VIDQLVALYNQSQDPSFKSDILTALKHSNSSAFQDMLLGSLRSDSRDERRAALSILFEVAVNAKPRYQEYLPALQSFRQEDNSLGVTRDLYKVLGVFARNDDAASLDLLKKDALEGRTSDSQLYALKQIPSGDHDLPKILSELRTNSSIVVQEEVLYRASTLVATNRNPTALAIVAGFLSPQTDARLQELALEKLEGFVPFLPLWGERAPDARITIQQSVQSYLSINPPSENLEKVQQILTQLSQFK
jgi:hypothetical protein